MSNRSPDEARMPSQHSLNPVLETEFEAELEQQWYTLEEKARNQMFDENSPEEEHKHGTEGTVNPFRKFKDKEMLTQQVANNLDVKRVKYNKQQSTSDEKMSPEDVDQKQSQAQNASATPFAPHSNNKESLR